MMETLGINENLGEDKPGLLRYYRNRASEAVQEATRVYSQTQFKKRTQAVNSLLRRTNEAVRRAIVQKAQASSWTPDLLLRTILLAQYCHYASMFDARNAVWPYEYMAFSRRVGELWERFCSLCFEYAPSGIEFFIPPLFADVQRQLKKEIADYIETLTITREQRKELLRYYEKVWSLITSGEIKLELDLHFHFKDERVNIDFKSGFGSNEKGNTNRLLLVATIYRNLEQNYRCVLLVRSEEDENNHYFQTLKNSSVWEAYCGDEAYHTMNEYSSFDLKEWIRSYVDWECDLLPETRSHFDGQGLMGYLRW